MQVKDAATRVERRRERRAQVNRAHIRAFLDAARYNEHDDEMDEPEDAQVMAPYVFGREVSR